MEHDLYGEDTTYISGFDYFNDGGYPQREPFCCEVYPDTVGQYVGISDKNGTKIFEGDIIKAGWSGWISAVAWDGARFLGFVLGEGEKRIVYVDMKNTDGSSAVEVIGNIHDQEDPQ